MIISEAVPTLHLRQIDKENLKSSEKRKAEREERIVKRQKKIFIQDLQKQCEIHCSQEVENPSNEIQHQSTQTKGLITEEKSIQVSSKYKIILMYVLQDFQASGHYVQQWDHVSLNFGFLCSAINIKYLIFYFKDQLYQIWCFACQKINEFNCSL